MRWSYTLYLLNLVHNDFSTIMLRRARTSVAYELLGDGVGGCWIAGSLDGGMGLFVW